MKNIIRKKLDHLDDQAGHPVGDVHRVQGDRFEGQPDDVLNIKIQ
jgi:hypothetical protein